MADDLRYEDRHPDRMTQRHHTAPIPPSITTTYRWVDGEPIYGEYGWMDSADFAADWEGDEPQEYVEERWERTKVIVHTAFPPLGACTYEDSEPCEEDAVVWQREDDVWMQACEKHRAEEHRD